MHDLDPTLAETIADGADCRWTVLPSLVEGLSGIAEFMIDMYRATGKPAHLERAENMADTVTWYAVHREEGTAFPGRWFMKLSTDFATGSAGIGLFLGRLLDPSLPRALVDMAADDSARPENATPKQMSVPSDHVAPIGV